MLKNKPIVADTPEAIAEALNLTAADAKEWQVQYELLKKLRQIVERSGLTHSEVARRARTSRTRVTAILNGKIDHVSSDLLIRIVTALGYRVKVSVQRTDMAA